MRFFLAAKRTFCVITLYALEIKALFFKARFVANLDDYKCVACCKRVYSCGETIKKHEVSFFLSDPVYFYLRYVDTKYMYHEMYLHGSVYMIYGKV